MGYFTAAVRKKKDEIMLETAKRFIKQIKKKIKPAVAKNS